MPPSRCVSVALHNPGYSLVVGCAWASACWFEAELRILALQPLVPQSRNQPFKFHTTLSLNAFWHFDFRSVHVFVIANNSRQADT